MALQQIANTDISSTGTFALGSVSSSALTSGRVTYATTGGLLTDSASLTYNGTILTSAAFSGALNGTVGATTPSTVVATSVTNSGLTSGRVTYAGASGLLSDSSNLTFNGTTLTANTIGAYTLSGTIAGGGNQINNVIIGNSTPLAGSFTTLSATGNATLGSYITLTGTGTALTGGSTTGYCYVGNSDSTNLIQFNGSSHATLAGQMQFFVSGATRATVSSTGLAINGNLSVTGTTTFAGDITTTLGKFYVVNTYGYYFGGSGNLTGFTGSNGTGTITLSTYGTTRATFDTNGVTLTGTISSSGSLTVKGQTHTAPWFAAERSSSTTLQFKIVGAENTGYTASTGTVSAPWTNVIDNNNSDFMISTVLGGGTGGKIILDGKVGIGTTSPTFLTEIVGGTTTVETTLFQIRSNASGIGTGSTIAFGNSTNASAGSGRVELAAIRDTASGSSFYIRTGDSSGTIQTRVRINESGNVGIGTGTTSPDARIDVQVSSGAGYRAYKSTTGGFNALNFYTSNENVIGTIGVTSTNDTFYLGYGTTPVLKWNSSGNVVIGSTTTPDALLHVYQASGKVATFGNNVNNNGNYIVLAGTVTNKNWVISNNMLVGGEFGIGRTSAAGGTTIGSAHDLMIDTSGNLLVGVTVTDPITSKVSGVTVTPSTTCFRVYSDVSNACAIGVTSTSGALVSWYYNGANFVGSVTTNGTGVTYGTASDYRLKTNVVDAPSGNIDDIKVRSFDWIADGSHQEYGMVAQELIEVAPYAVNKPENPDEMMGIDYSKLVPMMIKEIQNLKSLIESMAVKLKDAGVAGF